MYQQQLANAVP